MLKFVDSICGTLEAEIIKSMEEQYSKIREKQFQWYEKSNLLCVEGCGECCRNFEPDILESEALFMAAWIIENKPDMAEKIVQGIFPFPENKGCKFWNENSEYHCAIYEGRPAICRLFGACGNSGKNGDIVFKPCKFYPAEKLALKNPPLQHRQYSSDEIKDFFGTLPPLMSNLMEDIICLNSKTKKTELIQNILPDMIKRLLWIKNLCKAS